MIPFIVALALQAAPSLPSSPDPMPARRQPAAVAPQPLPGAPAADPAVVARYRACTEQVSGNAHQTGDPIRPRHRCMQHQPTAHR